MTPILRPKALRPGDLVAVAALANERTPDEVPLFERGVATIEPLGYRATLPMPLGIRAALDADALTLALVEPAGAVG